MRCSGSGGGGMLLACDMAEVGDGRVSSESFFLATALDLSQSTRPFRAVTSFPVFLDISCPIISTSGASTCGAMVVGGSDACPLESGPATSEVVRPRVPARERDRKDSG